MNKQEHISYRFLLANEEDMKSSEPVSLDSSHDCALRITQL